MQKLVTLIALALITTACATSPTGRSQLLLMPESEMDQMGVAAFTEMKTTIDVEKAAATNQYVDCVANAVIAVLPSDQQRNWEVVVFKDNSANAFALPGNKIGVHTGILKVASDQGQLAAIIGHEIGHVLAQHGNERMSIEYASQTSQQLLGAVMEGTQEGAMVMAAMGVGAQYGVALPYSRSHETEADLMGLRLMAKAGFDPRASVTLWHNMAANANGAPPEFMSTHPSSQSRIKGLQANMKEALDLYSAAGKQGKKPRCQ
ncbi:M48 family metallopeptidase [Oceanicoccus sagamiensis]|uniref:Peptidase n=1 Tax=Oceanicoccus sagamiensis TaxID=716816 RepID=A0A1X9NH00_9GAMM|nr:M48 family metallopeptidase [Oceanicoccus sagamiensis]ARN74217.1 peptidase [Oceanicoccus sagamiensis]